MDKRPINTINPEHRQFLAFFDVLGFKNLYEEIGLLEIESKYKQLIEVVENLNKEAGFRRTSVEGRMIGIAMSIPIKYGYFSDTILFWIDGDRHYNQDPLLDLMEEILCKSIEIGLPLRGSLNAEETLFDKDKSIYLGRSLINGAEAETAQRWIGATLSQSYLTSGAGFYLDRVLPYRKHIKEGKENLVIDFVIDFPKHWRKTRATDIKSEIQKLNKKADFSIYYQNTLDFCDFSEKMDGLVWSDISEFNEYLEKYGMSWKK